METELNCISKGSSLVFSELETAKILGFDSCGCPNCKKQTTNAENIGGYQNKCIVDCEENRMGERVKPSSMVANENKFAPRDESNNENLVFRAESGQYLPLGVVRGQVPSIGGNYTLYNKDTGDWDTFQVVAVTQVSVVEITLSKT